MLFNDISLFSVLGLFLGVIPSIIMTIVFTRGINDTQKISDLNAKNGEAKNERRENNVGSKNTPNQNKENESIMSRKDAFLKSSHGHKLYGYKTSTRGYIDTWREVEFPGLIKPVKKIQSKLRYNALASTTLQNDSENDLEVYLDYAGSSLPSLSLLTNDHKLSKKYQILANPHSSGIAASRTMELIENTKMKILEFFGAQAGPLYGCSNVNNCTTHPIENKAMKASEYHPGYEIIFTSGATESLRIIGENFQWTGSHMVDTNVDNAVSLEQETNNCSKSILIYPQNAHTSVIGMRECALAKGAMFHCEKTSNMLCATNDMFSEWESYALIGSSRCANTSNNNTYHHRMTENIVNNLLVLPLECNFGGTKFKNIQEIIKLSQNRSCDEQKPVSCRWYTVLDIAKAACTEPLNLREIDPDFACISFYKIFGYPTGIGALLVKRSSRFALTTSSVSLEEKTNNYFGGGAVDVVLSRTDFVSLRSSIASLQHGTVNFRSILSLGLGLGEIAALGGMTQISCHTSSLAIEAVKRLSNLVHTNGRKAVVLYGAWSKYDLHASSEHNIKCLPGPTIAFNIIRSDGSFVGYNEVSKLASLYKTPIQLRTGCFCNPGACQEALRLSDDEIKVNFFTGGHVCGDDKDIIDGKPTGAVRISFGKDSLWEDLDSLVLFLEKTFLSDTFGFAIEKQQCSPPSVPRQVLLSEIYVYPIKSCSAMKVSTKWKINRYTGSLKFDREFALVDSSGSALRLSTYPKMGLIKPSIDLETEILTVKAKGFPDLIIDIKSKSDLNPLAKEIKVCGMNKCGGIIWARQEVSQWFSSFLGVQCWLARFVGNEIEKQLLQGANKSSAQRTGFENESPILLITQNSVDTLNEVIKRQGSRPIDAKYFRPNFVVQMPMEDTIISNPEDSWVQVKIPRLKMELAVVGKCARCAMVDIDPNSGTKGGKTLRALAEYRRDQGKINFGIFLSSKSQDELQPQDELLELGEQLIISCE